MMSIDNYADNSELRLKIFGRQDYRGTALKIHERGDYRRVLVDTDDGGDYRASAMRLHDANDYRYPCGSAISVSQGSVTKPLNDYRYPCGSAKTIHQDLVTGTDVAGGYQQSTCSNFTSKSCYKLDETCDIDGQTQLRRHSTDGTMWAASDDNLEGGLQIDIQESVWTVPLTIRTQVRTAKRTASDSLIDIMIHPSHSQTAV